MSGRLLVIDDEPSLRELLSIVLEGEGYGVRVASTYREASQLLSQETFDLVICDIVLPDGNGLDLLRSHHATRPDTSFVMITAHSTPAHMLTSLREGAVEYLSKPFDVDELKLVVAKHLLPRASGEDSGSGHEFVAVARAMRPVIDRIPQVARSEATVLITGESGTGKELLARAIHAASSRAGRLFVPVNCGALPEGLLESELFGHVRGSFTGAFRDKRGLFQEAHGGSLFLDEVGELSPNMQVKLLRALQEKKVRPVGDTKEADVDARVIVATNQDLQALVQEGRFREDLYYRINVLALHVPPLRERREDIPILARIFVDRACKRLGLATKEIQRDVLSILGSYPWPGNVRELENIVEQAVAMEPSQLITLGSLPTSLVGSVSRTASKQAGMSLPQEGLDLEAHLDAIRRELMRQALERCHGVQKDAARMLRISYRAFRYHAQKFNLGPEE
ncbi:MAG: sigma-54-dependent transcriptional regulator [Acidobacteriota bacterium]